MELQADSDDERHVFTTEHRSAAKVDAFERENIPSLFALGSRVSWKRWTGLLTRALL